MINYRYEDIRNFYFENEYGKRIDCQKVNGNLFLNDVTGLGFEKEVKYVRVGNTFVKNEEEIKQGIISGQLEFYDMTYDEYMEFVNFVLSASSLRLIYVPKRTNRVEFYRNIDFIKMEQNGEDNFNIMTSPITIYCTSLWYEERKFVYTVEEMIDDELRWDFEWDSVFADYENRNILIENKGHVDAPFLLEMNGYILNPVISIYRNGEKINEIAIDIAIQENEKLIYSTKDDEMLIYKVLENGTQVNLFNSLDLNNTNFFKLPIRN